ncbi:uncharacterized protein LOC143904676 [Temnothorax americanus]|uniref:uncharacterized protein LOC143904676 n=1 Tax=Temnothorax americanus TaxID=1964332 RepID=UPI004068FDC7
MKWKLRAHMARMKLSRAVETDNFESAPESQERTKRKTKVPKRLDESSSEPDESDARSFLPSPSKIYHSQKHKKDIPKENKKVVKNNQDIELDRPYSGSSSSLMDSLPKQKSSNSSLEKSPSLQNTSRIYMPWKKFTKRTCFMNKMENEQYNISDDSTLRSEIESSAVASQMNHPSHDFDNINRQVSESQHESPPRNSAKRVLFFERSPRHHNIPPPKHLKQQYERSNNNTRVMPTQRIQGNVETPASMSREQSYPFDGIKRTFQEIIKN